ncbi:MAG TPA: cytochrome c oxidase subunit 3 [Pyrinomonadaceae bacterium]|jgi:cytochrome c oxidase subunit 3|nr:cytochrome c oxidase subunit 3 [Pyrinomonadaceae bacterium]
MVTTVSTKAGERVAERPARGLGLDGAGKRTGGNGSRGGNPPPGGGGDPYRRDETPHHYRIGMWIAVASILMLFMALTSAYVFRAAVSGWQDLQAPPLLWLSTAVIITSSLTFALARKSLRRDDGAAYRRWLGLTLLLGLAFLGCQLLAWRGLIAQGVYLSSSPHSSFFYLLTALHALHLAGGIAGLSYLLLNPGRGARAGEELRIAKIRRRAAVDAVGIYWHFMDGLWVYLFGLLFLWR